MRLGGGGVIGQIVQPSLYSIPASRITTWQPGVTYNTVPGQSSPGIPNRTTIFTTLSPIGGGADDTAQINTALANAAAVPATQSNPQVVLLNAGVFNINGNNIPLKYSWVTLRGSGLPNAMATGGNLANDTLSALNYVSGTWLVKQDRNTNAGAGIIDIGRPPTWVAVNGSTNLTADAVKGSKSCIVTSAAGLSVGQLVLIDHVTDTDPNLFYGNKNDLSGYFVGSLSGTSLTFTSAINGPTGVDGAFNGTFSGTSLTVNSYAATGYMSQMGLSSGPNPAGTTVYDTLGNSYGFIVSGSVPNFTMNQSNSSATLNLVLGGVVPQVGYPIFDSVFSTFYGFISSGTFPNFTMNQSNPTLTGVTLTAGGGSRRFFSRQDRAFSQLMRIATISGTTITFETPFHYTFKTAYAAQLSTFDPVNYPVVTGASIENLGLFGGRGGDFAGNCAIGLCMYCWVKNVESYWSQGTGLGMYGAYRCEVRDSFGHESPNPNPGGDGYLCGANIWSSDCLYENNVMWQGNKEIVMRGVGGGNVIAYNYLDDSFGGTFPESPEAGVNAGHYGGSLFCLMEGNYSQSYVGDSFWGSSFCHTAYRNWCSGIRGCSPTGDAPNITPCNNLRNYTFNDGAGHTYPYGDYNGRRMCDIQAGCYNHNVVGNIFGFQAQTLLSYNAGGYTTAQTTWVFENLSSVPNNVTDVVTFQIGVMQQPSTGFLNVATTYQTQIRDGNWDWHTQTQTWLGVGGTQGNPLGTSRPLPNSLYLTSKPPFFTTNSYLAYTWPWVNPAGGITATLPAKARFDAGTPNLL